MARVVPTEIISVIDQNFGWAARPETMAPSRLELGRVPALAGIVDLLDRLPDELLTLDDRGYAVFVVARGALRHTVNTFSSSGMIGWPRPGDHNALWSIRGFLPDCPDEPPAAAESNELAFIDDEQWRDTLRFDLGYVEAGLRNREWKAVTVLGGSLVEALLLWAVARSDLESRKAAVARAQERVKFNRQPDPGKPEGWDLIHYIEVARELGEISENTAIQARLAKDFRNLIHPGRERRQPMQCNRGTAFSVVAAVDQVMKNLSEKAAGKKVTD